MNLKLSSFILHPPSSLILERETRLELATLALARRCSTTELLPRSERHSILMIRDSLSRQRCGSARATAIGKKRHRQDGRGPHAGMRSLQLLWLRQWLRQNARDQLLQTRVRVVVAKLVKLCKLGHPLRLCILMLRIAPGERDRARVSVDDLVDHLVNVFQCRLAFSGLGLIAVALTVIL